MARQTAKKCAAAAKKTDSTAPAPKKARIEVSKEEEEIPVTRKTLGVSKKAVAPLRVSPRTAKAVPKTRGRPRKNRTDAHSDGQIITASDCEPDEIPDADQALEQIGNIIATSREREQEIIDSGSNNKEDLDEVKDSDDELSNADDAGNCSQLTMDGDKDYIHHPVLDAQDDIENADDEDSNVSNLQMVPETVDYTDKTKKHEDWWTEDPTRETVLCQLWQEAEILYVPDHPDHRNTDMRNVCLRRFATVLQVPPPIIEVRMRTIRNAFQKMVREKPSGSECVGETPRQREILRLASFLRDHVKTVDSVTSYKGRSPANKTMYSYKNKQKKEPQKKTTLVVETALDRIMNRSLTPIRKTTTDLTQSEIGSDVEDVEEEMEFVVNTKHFARNSRLLNPTPARRALDLSPSPTPKPSGSVKKTADVAKVKTTKTVVSSTPKVKPAPKSTQKKPTSTATSASTTNARVNAVPLTAAERLALLPKDNSTSVKSNVVTDEGLETAVYRKTSGQRVAPKKVVGKKSAPHVTKVADTSSNVSEGTSYDVGIDPSAWYHQQGAQYRKYKEDLAKKKAIDKNPLLGVMQEKSDSLRKMVDNMEAMNEKARNTSSSLTKAATPEQLWADSLVPQVMRMEQDIRDAFMVYVLGLAFKAIAGRWPEAE